MKTKKPKKENQKEFTPEFLYIPYVVMSMPQPADRFVFGAIYYFERMKDGKCTASNELIGRIAGVSNNLAVANSLTRLEKAGFIKRFYKDKSNKHRTEIRCLVKIKRVSSTDVLSTNDTVVSSTRDTVVSSTDDRVSSTDDTVVSSTDEQISKSIISKRNEHIAPTAQSGKTTGDNLGEGPNLIGSEDGSAEAKSGVNAVFDIFHTQNPVLNYGHRGMRRDAEEMIKKFGLDETLKMAQFAISVQGQEYAPVICDPTQFKYKASALAAYYKRGVTAVDKGGLGIVGMG